MSEEVIIERIDNLKEYLAEKFDKNDKAHENLKADLEETKREHGKRIKVIEDWKLVFTAKLSVYITIAVTLGSLVGTLLINWLGRYF